MSLIEEGLHGYLAGRAGLTALVSTRIYPGVRPQGAALPAVTYQVVGGSSDFHHGGAAGKARPSFQIDAWAPTYASAKAVAEQVKLAMFAFAGTYSGVVVDGATVQSQIDLYEPDVHVYRCSRDYGVIHTEAIA